MITQIENLPEGVLGFEVSGTVTSADYETVIVPAVTAAASEGKKLKLLYHIAPGFDKYELAALWEDARVGLKHFTAWEKVAVVTDVQWINAAVSVFGFMVPGQVKVFAEKELEVAKSWLAI